MNDRLTRDERIAVIRLADEMRERAEQLLSLLLPEDADGVCRHPPSMIEDESSMGEELYRCRQCGKTSETPFPTVE